MQAAWQLARAAGLALPTLQMLRAGTLRAVAELG